MWVVRSPIGSDDRFASPYAHRQQLSLSDSLDRDNLQTGHTAWSTYVHELAYLCTGQKWEKPTNHEQQLHRWLCRHGARRVSSSPPFRYGPQPQEHLCSGSGWWLKCALNTHTIDHVYRVQVNESFGSRQRFWIRGRRERLAFVVPSAGRWEGSIRAEGEHSTKTVG